mgnify:CR=1 FL=1
MAMINSRCDTNGHSAVQTASGCLPHYKIKVSGHHRMPNFVVEHVIHRSARCQNKQSLAQLKPSQPIWSEATGKAPDATVAAM